MRDLKETSAPAVRTFRRCMLIRSLHRLLAYWPLPMISGIAAATTLATESGRPPRGSGGRRPASRSRRRRPPRDGGARRRPRPRRRAKASLEELAHERVIALRGRATSRDGRVSSVSRSAAPVRRAISATSRSGDDRRELGRDDLQDRGLASGIAGDRPAGRRRLPRPGSRTAPGRRR